MFKVVFGIAGKRHSEKTELTAFLESYMIMSSIPHETVSYSQVIEEDLKKYDIPLCRENYQKWSIFIEEEFGIDKLTNAVWQRLNQPTAQVGIIEGIRYPYQALRLRRLCPDIKIVFVRASDTQRHLRALSKPTKKDYIPKSLDEYLAQEAVDTEAHIHEIEPLADILINNQHSFTNLHEEAKKCIDLFPKR